MSDRDAARRRRSAQNRREREAREARVARARNGPSTTSASSASSTSRTGGTSARSGSRSRRPSAADRSAARRQRWTDSDSPDPGARMVLLSVPLAVAAALMLYFFEIVPVEKEVRGREVVETVALGEEIGVGILPALAIPVLIAAAAWFATRWTGARRRRIWVVAAATQLLWVALAQTIGVLFIVSAISLAVGAWQCVQAERRNAAGAARADEPDEDDAPDDELLEDGPDEHDDPASVRSNPLSRWTSAARRNR